ncbi:hypothetical protein ABIB82_003354 [Bradyrhizobium sp. i1.8.4]|uniref:putative sensor domain DACNV-containing protein n=1 Tax=unclassified Bradyrhizobium TaxID=2631580 RepID=UPI003D1E8ABD
MPDLVDQLAHQVTSKIRKLGFDEPNHQVVFALLEMAYLGTMRSEEGRFVKGSLTFANPKQPDVHPPFLRRADYPAFTKFGSSEILTVRELAKLACAIDRWSGSIAVYTTRRSEIVAWGVVDQLVPQSVHLHRERTEGFFANPGLLTVTMDGIGDISAYHGNLFLGGIKSQTVITRENDALGSAIVSEYAFDALAMFANAIARVLDTDDGAAEIQARLADMWVTSIARLCIGLRLRGTGGAFLLTPKPIKRLLEIKHSFAYPLGDASILRVMDERYLADIENAQDALVDEGDSVPADLAIEASLADADAKDREEEMTGAVKLVTSLAAVDGLVLMTPTLSVVGFGVKIGSAPNVTTVYDGAGFARRGTRARKIDPTQFGTRHGSMLRYCAQDRKALGIVVSQDGYVRLIISVRKSLLFWDNLKLLNYHDFSSRVVSPYKTKRKPGSQQSLQLGYTDVPKTIGRLMKAASLRR